jgi:hypothetical protein
MEKAQEDQKDIFLIRRFQRVDAPNSAKSCVFRPLESQKICQKLSILTQNQASHFLESMVLSLKLRDDGHAEK